MNSQLLEYLHNVLFQLENVAGLSLADSTLFSISGAKLITPIGDVLPLLMRSKSKLKDQIIKPTVFNQLLHPLIEEQALIRINHIGFCYKVENLNEEKNRLIRLSKKTHFQLYEEPSNDRSLWFFLGNLIKYDATTLEFVLVEHSADRWVEYWLPHVQIDIDTTLSEEQIRTLVKNACGNQIKPYAIKIGGVAYIIRCRLGNIDGVNINLDLATNKRDVKYLREKIWKKIS